MLLLHIYFIPCFFQPADKWAIVRFKRIVFWSRILQFLKDLCSNSNIFLTRFTPVTKFLNFSPWMYDDVTCVTVNIWQSRSAGLSLLLHPPGDVVSSVQLGYKIHSEKHTRTHTHTITHTHPFTPCLSDSWVHLTVVHLWASVTAAW